MGFFSKLFSGMNLPEYHPLTSADGMLRILDYIKYHYYHHKMYQSGHFEIGGGECKYKDDVYGNAIKYSRELLELNLKESLRNINSGKWEIQTCDDDFCSRTLSCEFFNVRPYFDSKGIAHSEITIFYVIVRPSSWDHVMSPLSSPRPQQIVLRLESLSEKKWNATISRFSYFCCKNSDFIGSPETISDFSIQNCNNSNVCKEWIYDKASPFIWEKAEGIKYRVLRQ